MAKNRNRRDAGGAGARTVADRRPRRSARRRNRRGTASARSSGARTPQERKHRNRTVLLFAVLALVNLYVFGWRDKATLEGLSHLPDAVIAKGSGSLPPVANAPQQACGGHQVRIFEGLEDLMLGESNLDRARTLRLALLEQSVESEQIERIEAAIRPYVDLGLLEGSGAVVRLASDRLGVVHALEIELAQGHLLQACREGDGMKVRNIQHPFRTDVVAIGLELGPRADLEAAVAASEEAPELAAHVAHALAGEIDVLSELRPGDEIQILVEKRWLGRGFHRYGPVLALRFVGAAGHFSQFRYQPRGREAEFFDEDGRTARRTLLRSPVGYHRVHPDARALLSPQSEVIDGRQGVAIRLSEGAPLVALGHGVVRFIGPRGELGQAIEIAYEDGIVARYAHLLRVAGGLEVGSRVRQGQWVALAGHSGKTPNDRLRLEMWRDEGARVKWLDPLLLFSNGSDRPARVGDPLDDAAKQRFSSDMKAWSRALRLAAR